MTDYSHLQAPSFDLRKVMAAHYLQHTRRIVEVGGGSNPIYRFIHDDVNRQYWIIDPDCEPVYLPGVQHCKMGIQDFSFHSVPTHQYNSGLCLLGLELDDPDGKALKNIISNIPRFHMIVLDYVIENEHARSQCREILDKAGKEDFSMAVSLTLGFTADVSYFSRAETPSPSFGKTRSFTVLIQE